AEGQQGPAEYPAYLPPQRLAGVAARESRAGNLVCRRGKDTQQDTESAQGAEVRYILDLSKGAQQPDAELPLEYEEESWEREGPPGGPEPPSERAGRGGPPNSGPPGEPPLDGS